ncbi:MAG TPA: trypsin-like peptidase domain-containing protein [Vicinamibacterales bacterium]|nr:trypsin-like peptidase domain-containing protein [Vicinamibacterales bacterium]
MRLLRLRFTTGARRGEELIFSGPRVRIGRSRDNTLVLTDTEAPLSSGHHAEAILEHGAWWIVDSGSRNGTFVNGVRVPRARLSRGDAVRLGDDQFVVAGRSPVATAVAIVAAAASLTLAGAWIATRRHPAAAYDQVAQTAARSVYAVIIDEGGRRTAIGTAFAVTAEGRLATNAHVADLLQQRGVLARDSARRALAVRGDTFDARRIGDVTMHPQWLRGSIRNDVALLRLEPGEPLTPLAIASDGDFARLQRGTALASFGFPAIATDPMRPRGRLSVDVVGDVRGDYLQAGLSIAPGTSGSPVFNEAGSVVAIVAGGDFVAGKDGVAVPSGSQVNWAINADRLREILPPR